MSAIIMDGTALAKRIKSNIRKWTNSLFYVPGLAVVMVGNDLASETYVAGKIKDCGECGFYSEKYIFDKDTCEENLIDLIKQLNTRRNIHGILLTWQITLYIAAEGPCHALRPELCGY